ncbi:hypothetical protein SMA5143A_7964 [Streptomyces sp. MA5143a]|nr:hypothetical protein SMA5143A_7964 [Streptomyces sp. MA5143a]
MRNPGRQGPALERFRPHMEEPFSCVDWLADRHGALAVDLHGAPSLSDPRTSSGVSPAAPRGDGRSGARFSAEPGQAFWVTPADRTGPGPVTDLRRMHRVEP